MTKFSTLLIVALLVVLTCSLAVAQTAKVDKLQVGSTAFSTGKINIAPATNAAGGIYFGPDVTLYRSAANTLKTDDNLTVTGTLSMGTFEWTNASATGTWTVTGATTLNGAVTLGDAVADAITIKGAPTFKEAVIAEKTLAVTGNTTVGGTLGVTGASTLASAGITGNATVGGTLAVTGASTFTGAVTGNGAWVIGDAVGDTVTVNGAPTFKEAVIAEKTLAVTGNATLGGTLAVTGATTLTGATTFVGLPVLPTLASDPLDATPADRPAGVVNAIGVYGGALYLCTDATVDAEVWVKVGPA